MLQGKGEGRSRSARLCGAYLEIRDSREDGRARGGLVLVDEGHRSGPDGLEKRGRLVPRGEGSAESRGPVKLGGRPELESRLLAADSVAEKLGEGAVDVAANVVAKEAPVLGGVVKLPRG